MNAAQYFESNLPSTSRSLFFQTWPGWVWGRYEHRKLYAEHRFLADMLPVTSTFTGHLATAEAIYDDPHNNLVGIETFSGPVGNQAAQHAVLLGMSGAGKPVTAYDLSPVPPRLAARSALWSYFSHNVPGPPQPLPPTNEVTSAQKNPITAAMTDRTFLLILFLSRLAL